MHIRNKCDEKNVSVMHVKGEYELDAVEWFVNCREVYVSII